MQLVNLIHHSIGLLAPLNRDVAYLDPGTGSFLLQMLLATLLGGLFLVRAFWSRIKDFFGRLFSKGGSVAPNEADVDDQSEEPPEA